MVEFQLLAALVDNDAWWLGMFIGLMHGLVVGAMAMPMMHPRMERDAISRSLSGGATVAEAGEVRLAATGMLGSRWGKMTDTGRHLDGPCRLRGDPGAGLWTGRGSMRPALVQHWSRDHETVPGVFRKRRDPTGFPPT